LIGESLGLWGNTRRSLYLGIFLFVFIVAMVYLQVGREGIWIAISNLLVNGGFIVLLMVMYNQQLAERQKAVELAESLESANAKLAAYNAKIESLTLQNERQRMARELHDTLAQGVAGLVLQLEAVKAHLASDRKERAAEIVEQSIARARSTLAESRAAIDNLRAVPVNAADVVREKVEHFKQSTGVACEVELSVTENQLETEVIDHAMNILSESLTNISRHAQATQVKVKFLIQKETLELEVRDNGKGFDVKQETKGHYGLVGMHERARLMGGQLVIESNPNGTCVQFVVGRV
jgi:NarL family two-component system sensor histidine kinase YdfH